MVVIEDVAADQAPPEGDRHARKRARKTSPPAHHDDGDGRPHAQSPRPRVLDPDSPSLLDDMLFPLSSDAFLAGHFRRDAVHVSRRGLGAGRAEGLVSGIRERLFGLDRRTMFAETSSESVFLWLGDPPTSGGRTAGALNSVEVADPDACAALQASGGHAAYW